MQMVIIIMTFLTLLAVMGLLRVQFLDTMANLGSTGSGAEGAGSSGEFGADIDTGYLSMVFFHAVTLQAVVSSFIAGYIRSVELMAGLKYAVVLATITLVTWTVVEQISAAGSSDPTASLLLLAAPMGRSVLTRAHQKIETIRTSDAES
jgi:flagellar protein FlaJ